MNRGEKRSFEQIDSSADEYVYSASEIRDLEALKFERPRFVQKPENEDLNLNIKMAALKLSSSVVSLLSFTGEIILSQACGTIFESNENNHTVITSLNLIRKPTDSDFVENTLADNLKIVVLSSEKRSYIGEIDLFDFHYNLLIIKFKSKTHLRPAKFGMIDDGVDMNTSELRPHSTKTKPGDQVLVVGRYFYGHLDFMAAPGHFSVDRRRASKYDCRELLSASCNITRCGDGGALLNMSGEIVGIAFYENAATSPVLPISVVSKWWNHYNIYKELRHPSYGFEAINLYLAFLPILESAITSFPNISNGLLVEKVLPGSYAESAGLRQDDIIIKCNGTTVKSFLELWDLIWDKVGSAVELGVARLDPCTLLTINMVVGEAIPHELNKWPRYDYR